MGRKVKTLTTEFTIKNGRLIAQLDRFLLANEGKEGELKLKIVNTDKVMYWRHKYYRSILLPYIAQESYDGHKFKAHMEMKKKFLYMPCSEYAEIPERHLTDKTNFLFDYKDQLKAYLPSTGNLTDEEMKKYILQVEGIVLELQISLTDSEMITRNKAVV